MITIQTDISEELKLTYNKLISEFIGELYEKGYINQFATEEDNVKENMYNIYYEPYRFYLAHAKFHSSWDWLMPVIDKINELGKEVNFTLHKTYYSCSVAKVKNSKMYKSFNFAHSEIKYKGREIEGAFLLVGKFLTWYNENKNDEALL